MKVSVSVLLVFTVVIILTLLYKSTLILTQIIKERTFSKNKEGLRIKPGIYAPSLSEELVDWTRTIQGEKVYSQNDEDGALRSVFERIGNKDKVYVEFGVEDCIECNTRYLRENLGWNVSNSLLMDGGFENPAINLRKVIFWPDNIIQLFQRFKVKKEFDLLSVDMDSYDFYMLETILESGYRPRVIITEYNADFQLNEAKSIMKPEDGKSWLMWDHTKYQGMSLLAAKYLLERFHYSMVWCNKVNCIGIQDSALGSKVRLDIEELYQGSLDHHWCDTKHRPMAIIGEDGRWSGEDDGGEGSPNIRCGHWFLAWVYSVCIVSIVFCLYQCACTRKCKHSN